MKVIIAGTRTITSAIVVDMAIRESLFEITEVVSGTATGPDQLGEAWAVARGIPVKQFPADWEQHGLRAGFIRNVAMADYADALIAIWDGQSKGTEHMIKTALKKGLKVYILEVVR